MPSIHSNGIQLHYQVQGTGEPVLMIMGITASASVREAHVADWPQHFQCILPDNRGVGVSDAPAGDYTSAMMAGDMAGLLDAIGCGPVAVVGCSMGSIIAQGLALRYPNKVSRLVLMCPWARCDRRARATFEHLVTLKAKVSPEEFMNYVQLLIFHKRSWDDHVVYESMLEARCNAQQNPTPQSVIGLRGQAAACINHSVLDLLHTITVPTLIIGGEDDQFTPRWMAEEIHARIVNSSLHLYPHSGHSFHWENSEDFNRRVLAFFEQRGE